MKVLINENNEDIRKLYEVIFSPYEAEITFAEDADDAQASAEKDEYDLVFLDVGFPDMEGIAVADHLHNKVPEHSLVLVSSVPVSKIINDELKKSISLFMKPLDIKGLQNLIRSRFRLAPSMA